MSRPEEDPSLRLVELIQANEERKENLHRLFSLHWQRVYLYFRNKGFPLEESKDLTQDVFLRVFKAIDGFRREAPFEWWLLGIAKSIYKNTLRSKKAEKRDGNEQSLDAPISDENSSSLGETLVAPVPSPLEDAVEREQVAALRAALKELPAQMRLCCLFRYEKGLKYQEIAVLMDLSIETIKAHLFQGRKRLGSMLSDLKKAGKKGGRDGRD